MRTINEAVSHATSYVFSRSCVASSACFVVVMLPFSVCVISEDSLSVVPCTDSAEKTNCWSHSIICNLVASIRNMSGEIILMKCRFLEGGE